MIHDHTTRWSPAGETAISRQAGFTLIELVIVIVIIGILAAGAIGTGRRLFESGRTEETRQEMDRLAVAIVGNPKLENNGMRTDYGYVGDVGSLPPDLASLASNTGGLGTWNGPYISSSFAGAPNDFSTDAWGRAYTYAGGLTISSTGSGSALDRQLAGSLDHLLRNSVSGSIVDANGSAPGVPYNDSINVQLVFPDGAGGYNAKSAAVSTGGFFRIDSVPVGNHSLQIVYQPTSDTLIQFVGISPGGDAYAEHRLGADYWTTVAASGLVFVPLSDSLRNSVNCNNLSFWIANNGATDVTVEWVILDWSSPVGWYKDIWWNSTRVASSPNPNFGAGDTATFSATQTIAASESVYLDIRLFNSTPEAGGSGQDMSNVDLSITFSDGTVLSVPVGPCN